ncbi:MAG TPA: beta-galactosidase GalB [Chitinophagaceae bacterium]|nr:beta-galactosidase GalB [Chitinophagaceae bacterium]
MAYHSKKLLGILLLPACLLYCSLTVNAQTSLRSRTLFTKDWRFYLGNDDNAKEASYDDAAWRKLDLPHDWSIELPFDEHSPAGTGGGVLDGGIGWYRKTFTLPGADKIKKIFIDFDGVYRNSEVWINGHYLGKRPYGFSSFRYELTPYLNFGTTANVIAVKVDNSQQPNSRWYSGSGIYRYVWLVKTNDIYVDHWGTHIQTPKVDEKSATVVVNTKINNVSSSGADITVKTSLYNDAGQVAKTASSRIDISSDDKNEVAQTLVVANPSLWSIEHPHLYKAVTQLISKGKVVDEYTTTFGIRWFTFDINNGFFLNGKHVKIWGVCDHHDLGCLGTAINKRALQRQLEILKDMGINGIRTSHNPPAPELLDLCDQMGFIVMDEAFDMWKKAKTKYDYHLDWDEWHKRDMEDFVTRDRNHPSVFIWSIGNEIPEQWKGRDGKDTSGTAIARELGGIVHSLDTTRPITSALNQPSPDNAIWKSGVIDLFGYNYHHQQFKDFQKTYPGVRFIGTETVSALETRGHYDMPSDSIQRWPGRRRDTTHKWGNADLTVSAYDNISVPWGSTHEETMKEFLKYPYASGMYVWTGFDYIGEPTPYPWPARSSYFGIIDLAGFPKDAFYLYQSVCTDKPVLHLFPHWNWTPGQTIDVWAYYNNADEVELFVNGKSAGIKKKEGDDLHVMWRVQYEPGSIKAISRKNGKVVLTREIKTAGKAAKIVLSADRSNIHADGDDLSFITVRVEDADGNLVPDAANDVKFSVTGQGSIAGVDNGSETSLESFKADHHKAFNGLCLLVVRAKDKSGAIHIAATSDGLQEATLVVTGK